ncbi:XRE family transcriptional regulator [Salinicola salarius]|uniref:XRE family transcriptional regulator n=1 Tax=Salinicola salarius TaxID=430457 RepID=UPI000DA13BE1|nr:helix-turn-helix transcriptional regulator [Salinicola salarius]
MSDTTEVIAERLATLRREHGMTQDEFSRFLHIPRGRYANWEVGLRSPKLDDIATMADRLNVPPQWIVGWTNDKSNAAIGGISYVRADRASVPTDNGTVRITNPSSLSALSSDYLERHGLNASQVLAIIVDDEEMRDVCKQGDEVVIDRNHRTPGNHRDLFGILLDGHAAVRWIRHNLDGTYSIFSEKDQSPPPITAEKLSALTILGRVIRIAADR